MKTLTATVDEFGMPDFNFDGEWTGKDINLIIRLLKRRYWIFQLNKRRGGIK